MFSTWGHIDKHVFRTRDHLSAGLVFFNYFNDNFPSSSTISSTSTTLSSTTTTPNPLCNPSRFKGDLWKPPVGYTCPAGYLSYLACIISSEWSSTGGSNIYWSVSNSNWVVNFTTANYAFEASAARNITCFPAMEPTHTACSGNVPRFGNALLLGDSFGCMSGFTWNYFKLVGGSSQSTQPVCSAGGWMETAGGTVMIGVITEMWCKPNCGQTTIIIVILGLCS